MPLACFAGGSKVFQHASTSYARRVWADGGTFSAHPASLIVAHSVIKYLIENEKEIYPALIDKARNLRAALNRIFNQKQIPVHITGDGPQGLPDFPIGTIRFLKDPFSYNRNNVLSHWDESVVDIDLRDRLSRMGLMLQGVHSWQGFGVIVYAHNSDDLAVIEEAYEQFASTIQDLW
jgi:glutamate-1-semialdehyde 2,1-aminomutase